MDRRQLLRALGFGALGAGIGTCGVSLGGGPGCGLEQPLPLTLGELFEFPLDTVRDFPEHELAVIRRERGLVIVSTRCTHLGCQVRLSGQEWSCPCHGGRFALDGAVLGGPPPAPLPWLRGAVSGEGLVQVLPTIENPERTLVVLAR
jgi:cytochrome b6-f complex iron-sulfur subunit